MKKKVMKTSTREEMKTVVDVVVVERRKKELIMDSIDGCFGWFSVASSSFPHDICCVLILIVSSTLSL